MNKRILTSILFLLFTSCSTFAMEKSQSTSLKKENPSVHLEKKSNMNEILQSFAIFAMGFISVVFYTMVHDLSVMYLNFEYSKEHILPCLHFSGQTTLNNLVDNQKTLKLSILCGFELGYFYGLLLGLALVIFARISFAGMKEKIGWQELVGPLLGWFSVLLLGSTLAYGLFYWLTENKKAALGKATSGAYFIGTVASLFLLYYIYYKRSNTQEKHEKTRVSSQR